MRGQGKFDGRFTLPSGGLLALVRGMYGMKYPKICLVGMGAAGWLMLAGIGAAVQAQPAFFSDPSMTVRARYDACLKLIQNDPQLAHDGAVAWGRRDGDLYAVHCQATALIELGQYAQGAQLLSNLVHRSSDVTLQVQLLIQAGNGWMMADQPGQALPLFTRALAISPRNLDALTDRARARAMRRDWTGAESDLTLALSLDPSRADLFVLRASAFSALGRKDKARADIDEALDLVPNYAEALVERGGLRLEAGDRAGARQDWNMVLKRAPDSSAAISARARLAAMGTKTK